MKKKRPPKSGGKAPGRDALSAGTKWLPSATAVSDSTLKHLVFSPPSRAAEWESSGGNGGGGGGCSVSLTVPSFICAEGTISGTAEIIGSAGDNNITVTKPDGSQVSGSSPFSFTYTPPPGSFGTSVTFTATSNECGSDTKSTKVIWVRFTTSDPWEDNKAAELTVTANPLTATDISSVTWSAVPDVQGTAKNALNSTTLNFSQVGQDKFKWKVDVVKWFADSPSRLCFDTTAKYKVKVTAIFQGGSCSYERRVTVNLPTSNCETTTSPVGGLPEIKPPEPHPTIANWYRCEIVFRDVVFEATVHVDDTSQYKEKCTKEENFHKKQLQNQVPRAQGGCQDIWTAKGMKYWVGYAGTGPFFIEASTPEAALAAAYAVLTDATKQEGTYCTNLLGSRNNTTPRYCFAEQVAKGPQGADFKEAYTLPCAYPSCSSISNDTHIAWQ